MSGRQRLALVVAAAVIVVLAFVVLQPEGDDETAPASTRPVATAPSATTPGETVAETEQPPEPEVTRIRVRAGEPVGGPATIEAETGDTVQIVVSSDTPQHVHLHGYDVIRDAAPGAPARFRFEADLEGIFEIELEGPHTQVAELRVEP